MPKLTDESPMPFGKYKGDQMINVPPKYLLWLYEEGCSDEAVTGYIDENLDVIEKEAETWKD